ncbi:MAG TPA: prepilin-type N-terminal cleavage/methylation domain-containing protein [Anaerohalosphaeraceae bacterium]|nr:prepilin-type N-terminal cleavage/methylation domain-containing protein [Anaerohalosphaeraceae bacterium]
MFDNIPTDVLDENVLNAGDMHMSVRRQGLTLMELMVVILIAAILSAAAVPLLRGKIERSKWAEANAAAGVIRNAVKVYFLETGDTLTGNMADAAVLNALHLEAADITGTYFTASDYVIDNVDTDGTAVITVTASKTNAPSGSKKLTASGSFE